jgi:hypothetical protein
LTVPAGVDHRIAAMKHLYVFFGLSLQQRDSYTMRQFRFTDPPARGPRITQRSGRGSPAGAQSVSAPASFSATPHATRVNAAGYC